MPSLVSVKMLSGIISALCAIYLITSIFHSFSFRNTIGELRVQSRQLSVNRLINTSNFTLTTMESTLIRSANLSTKSFICDYVKSSNEHNKTSLLSFENHRLNALHPYCDILPTPRNKWVSAKRYVESDIVFIIYTAAKFYQNRATATRDTWLSRVTHKYFFSSTPYSPLPITVIEGVGEDYNSNMRKFYKGIQFAYQEHNQTAKFYYLAGCDTFVNVPHILKRLEDFDYQRPYIVGGHPYYAPCFNKKNMTLPPVTYPSGGAGFFLSAGAMDKMYPKIEPFFEDGWPIEFIPYSDLAISCLAKSMDIKAWFQPGFWPHNPERTLEKVGRAKLHDDPEPNTFHYVHPTSMYVLDEFYVFQHIDRLANDHNLDELVSFTRKFVAAHYELLRIKQTEHTSPTVKPTKKQD